MNIYTIKIRKTIIALIVFCLCVWTYGEDTSKNGNDNSQRNTTQQETVKVNDKSSTKVSQQGSIRKNFNNSRQNKEEKKQGKPETVGTQIRRYPPIEQVRAPITGKPSMNPMVDLKPRSIRDAFTQPLTLGSEAEGFIAPDWKQPFKDVKADRMQRELETGKTVMQGHVHLRLGELLF
ncbi:MAG: hypothetical protein ACP5KS_11805, partial [Candidatus Hydrogenedens sp.]